MTVTRSLLVVAVGLAVTAPRAGADDYFGRTYEAGGLTSSSGWESILKTPRIFLQYPLIELGGTFVALPLLCARDERLELRGPGRAAPGRPAPRTHLVGVFRAPLGFRLNHATTYLFDKRWEVPPCDP